MQKNKIYTRKGDDGSTGILADGRVSKCCERVEACGEVDELNSWIGLLRTCTQKDDELLSEKLASIQNDIFRLGCALATPADSKYSSDDCRITPEQITKLENWIDEYTEKVPPLHAFILPGGSELNAYFHISRSVCRRAERRIVSLASNQKIATEILSYMNRLSDLLFTLARYQIHSRGLKELIRS